MAVKFSEWSMPGSESMGTGYSGKIGEYVITDGILCVRVPESKPKKRVARKEKRRTK